MAKQLDFLASGQIIPTALHQEMERSYLEYAMSVIVGRALPDVRDGLKPVHRRILYAMHELGLTPDRPFRKCARVVGDVLGKYHPHGDQSVYEALVRMVQDFSSRYPLLSGHGNFGSIDNDPPAAMRYTETRLAGIGDQAVLGGISEAIVNFSSNFDNSQQEPVVLPAQLPILILNGCSGIAVGMATNIPPHNLGEVVEGLIALIDNPDLSEEKLVEIIPGPDFPTGGEILDNTGIREAYRTGRGIIPVRGVAKTETIIIEGKRRRERTAIVVTELPFQVNKAAWIEKIAELVNLGKLEGIADIRDESNREGIRVVIELKRESQPQQVLAALYQQTALQTNFGAIILALVDNQPRQLSLKEVLQEFLRFRETTLTRQYGDELQQASDRLHLVEGLLLALQNIDRVVDILKNAPDGTTAKYRFRAELGISDPQADSILAMPLRRLTGLERQKLETEATELQTKIQQLETLLHNRQEFLKSLKKELRSLKKKFADSRRTKIRTGKSGDRKQETEGKKQDSVVKKQDTGDGRQETEGKKQDSVVKKQETVPMKKFSPPQMKEVSFPTPHTPHPTPHTPHPTPPLKSEVKKQENKVKKKSESENTPSLSLFTPQEPPENAILLLDAEDKISWTTPEERAPDQGLIIYQQAIEKRENFLVILDNAKAYPIATREVPPQANQPVLIDRLLTKTAQKDSEAVLNQFFLTEPQKNQELLLLSQQGRIKRLPINELEGVGSRGLSLMKLKEDDRLYAAIFTQEGLDLAIATSSGRVLRYPVREELLPMMGKSAQGVGILRLRYGENLAGCVSLPHRENLLLISGLGYGKRLAIENLRLSQLGDLGSPALQFVNKQDSLAAMVAARAGSIVLLSTNQNRQLPLEVETVTVTGKDGTGSQLVKLNPTEKIIKAQLLHRL
ncbi:MAG: DNA topoisomerase 4 subunit A [Microcystis wesenbergii Mw_QC_S_20081001_S30D]|uniref:DNA topoisomerase (ATP-hydrolyzing) n=1 Tax=Microcystis wesenbergii Mw_QC_S_20081001_S30D TaxID=2486245 RepID=A0A552JRG6_9CHRO|nr:DNA topoisomerase 4 subunit A [Microcystis aeruginosa W11-03]NCR95915.1 DNA topoisomerase 4 subunit A [Microcystis aeruginosa W11-06]TRU98340.1 MAG: DNA topoisomerase 4 subunit A [Microcystis wesenbergii Mw_QC_S_20081001_S30D]TRV00352.1 MAG: DNA topoisomerase 4 subunit A [Microcystis wesenbergii Mw_QC_B_20070930_S4D]TRV00483.1 MAG: DNA topoisomerase 4 subunit A [Microcystis wesenbergii Mw_QC_S_20081001_S30]TRV13586.1 MAG: DNA topoisomerase 4 subunit A [Microcystis wesenbergii Mw_QC_B_200709